MLDRYIEESEVPERLKVDTDAEGMRRIPRRYLRVPMRFMEETEE